jgi:hypothetical protein
MTLEEYSRHRDRYGTYPSVEVLDAKQYETLSFITQTVTFISTADEVVGRAFLGRVRGALDDPDNFRGLAFELTMATHLLRNGVLLRLPAGRYDWLAERDRLKFEVECKSISFDKGRQIHTREFLELSHIIKQEVFRTLHSLTRGILVRVRVPTRLPSAHIDKKRIAAQVKEAILSAQDGASPLASVSQQHFELIPEMPWDNQDGLRDFLRDRFEIVGQRAIAIQTESGGALLLVVESETPDDLLGQTMDTLRVSGREQLSSTNPGILCAKFEGITADELIEVAEEREKRPSALRMQVSRLMDTPTLRHVALFAFVADGKVEQTKDGTYTRVGASYVFWNPRSEFKEDARLRLFDEDGG